MLVLAANADHHKEHEHKDKEKTTKKAVVSKDNPKDLKQKQPSKPILVNKVPRKRPPPPNLSRNYKLKNIVRTSGPKSLKKLPLPPRKSRRINPVKKQQNRRRVLKKVPNPKVHPKVQQKVQHKRPQRVNNFSRFLRAFGRQLNRPVL